MLTPWKETPKNLMNACLQIRYRNKIKLKNKKNEKEFTTHTILNLN